MIRNAAGTTWYVIRSFLEKFERILGLLALVGGFIFDSFTLTRIDFWFENFAIIFYLTIALSVIVLSALHAQERVRGKYAIRLALFAPVILQFTFGGLFSAFLVFFVRSASFSASWPFLLVLVGVLLGNEFFRERYGRFSFQMLIWFFALYLYLTLIVPVLVGDIGFLVFLTSGVVALFIVLGVIRFLETFFPVLMRHLAQTPFRFMVGLFVIMNVLYVLNIIPPIPLSLKEAAAYEYVARLNDGSYQLERTEQAWYVDWFLRDRIEVAEGGTAYFFSSVFSPTRLSVSIVHHWQRFDETSKSWRSVAYVPYTIFGGRTEGYRGYTQLEGVTEGKWRVRVETERGQLLGRETFTVVLPQEPSTCLWGFLPEKMCFWR